MKLFTCLPKRQRRQVLIRPLGAAASAGRYPRTTLVTLREISLSRRCLKVPEGVYSEASPEEGEVLGGVYFEASPEGVLDKDRIVGVDRRVGQIT